MDRAKWPAISGLLLGTVILTRTIPTSFALDRPTHSAVAILVGAGGAVVALSRWLPRDHEEQGRKNGRQYAQLPLVEVGRPYASREFGFNRKDVTYVSSQRKLRALFVFLLGLICLRVEVLRQVAANMQCATRQWNVWIPVAIAVREYWSVQRSRRGAPFEAEQQDGVSMLEKIAVQPYARVLAALVFALGGGLALKAVSSPASTSICAASLHYWLDVPWLQRFASLIDIGIAYCIDQLFSSKQAKKAMSPANRFALIGVALLVCAGFWLAMGGVYWYVQETGREWLLTIPHLYIWSVMKLNVYVAFTITCALLTVYHVGMLTTSFLATLASILATTTAAAWNNAHPFPTMHIGVAFCAIILILGSFLLYLKLEACAHDQHSDFNKQRLLHRIPAWTYAIFTAFLFIWVGLWLSHHQEVTFHPIDMVMYEAQGRHEVYAAQAATSKTLVEAAESYRLRYKRHPPPGFDHWFEFAANRNSSVIDDFDSIYRDLLPFHALTPAEIRERTWTLVANPWNDAAGISVRDGRVAISPNVVPTHRWMLEGIVDMISKFADKLPDMDLAFNLNDECRISVPHEEIEPLRWVGRQANMPDKVDQTWSASRDKQWRPIPEQPLQDSPLREASWQPVFHRFGNNGCPPGSSARAQRTWDTGSLCRSCVHPHSMGAFLSNWTTAGDVCHQPDLADLHGFYLSPAAFKSSPHLYPVFSQSKAGGFNDIIYPSAWNYIDKAKYEPTIERPDLPFAEKKPVLFWRGATSEGFSHGGRTGQWRGMARQRFAHLTSSTHTTAPDQAVLVNSKRSSDRMEYQNFPVKQLSSFLATDVHFVDSIVRCAGQDCSEQEREFAPLVPPLDFQEHWQYKYLLDLDGAGFSGRFLPFLRSKSLPFKAALFREWWDDRVEAWVHFVPLDLRGQGLWATLAYFQGLYATLGGRAVRVEGHQREAERITSQGREWAERVLRKEDMEIYMFRLLLEWGRLTDDKRSTLGFGLLNESRVEKI